MSRVMVTVGFCVRNGEATLGEAIESVMNQDFPHELMELIFVDDGSEDRTLAVIEFYASRVDMKTRVFSDKWKGLGAVRNTVVNKANGDYIVWVDADMALAPDFIRIQVEFMERYPNVGIAKGSYKLSQGPNLAATLEIYSRAADKMRDFNKNDSKALGAGACIYRRAAIKQAGGFDANIKGHGEDWDAECKIRAAGWLLETTEAQWRDYERFGLLYRDLWLRYAKRGYDLYFFSLKNKGLVKTPNMLPPASFLSGLRYANVLYKIIQKKMAFLLPFHHAFKSAVWFVGYFKAALNHADLQQT